MPERHLFAMLILREVSPLRAWMLFLLLALAAGLALLLLPLPRPHLPPVLLLKPPPVSQRILPLPQ